MKTRSLIIISALQVMFAFAQKQAPQNWFHLDPKKDKYNGVSTDRAYEELLKGKQGKPVIVAVIDGGTEVAHEDLKSIIWVNPGEIPGNGIDDDRNGYIDDVNGWNFIGGAKENIDKDNLEVTRVYRTLKAKFANVNVNNLEGEAKEEYEYYLTVKAAFEKGREKYESTLKMYDNLSNTANTLRRKIGKDSMAMKEFKAYKPINAYESITKMILESQFKGKNYVVISQFTKDLNKGSKDLSKFIDYHYNLEFDPREEIVADTYDNTRERYYGNNRVSEPNGDHGTHVAGIIAAVRNNDTGMNGIADQVQIMVLRVVPDGDERDKDVANGIRYAVDMGARVINMSFGKPYSPYKEAVDEAIRYALSKDVLLIHAAGNDHQNTDTVNNFPTFRISGYQADNWIEVGASSWEKKKNIPATFSNFGKNTVDVFAPGVDIYSCIPESKYASFDGTSMAAPVTAGIAAVIRSYYPELTAAEVKAIILESAIKVKGKVYVPGSRKMKVSMTELCRTGGIVNLYEALRLAEQKVKGRK